MSTSKIKRYSGIVSVVMICFFLASCATKATQRRNAIEESFDKGDYSAIVKHIKDNEKQYGETNAFLYHMDLGVMYHYMGEYETSNQHLAQAADIYDELFTRSVTNEAAALLTNDNVRPYRAKPYELIMLHQMAAFNFMLQGRFEESLVETRKAQVLFNEWERTKSESNKYHTDGMSHLFSSLAFEATDEPDNSMISLFKSVQAFKLGPVDLPKEVEGFAYDRLKANDREDDIGLLGISPNNDPNKWTSEQGETEIIVVGYAGKGPNMKQVTWRASYHDDGRLYIQAPANYDGARPKTFYFPAPPLPEGNAWQTSLKITLAFPELQAFPSKTSHFTAVLEDANRSYRSVVVNDFNLQAEKALNDAWNDIILRTITRVAVRTIAAEQVKKRTDTGNPLLNLAANVATDIAADQMEKADTRMCFLLPQQVHAIRFPVEPGTHTVSLMVHDFHGNVIGRNVFENVEVKRGEKKVLIHKSLR